MAMTNLSPQMKAFSEALLENDRFGILTHKRPDGDTIGSAAALCLALRKAGKTAYLMDNSEVPDRLSKFFRPYVAPEGFAPDNIVTTDIPSYSQMDALTRDYRDRLDFVIDHHSSNAMAAGKAKLVETSAAATGEIIFYLIKALGVQLDGDIGTLIYIAISTDTGCFKYSNTTSDTHRIAAECIDAGINLESLNMEFFEKKRLVRFEMERLVYSGLQFYCDGKIASIYISQKMRDETGASEDDIDDFSSIPRQIEGVVAGISVYQQKDGSMKISLRTTSEVDAAEVCRKFGGGGHPRAAGCNINADHDTAVKMMIDELKKMI